MTWDKKQKLTNFYYNQVLIVNIYVKLYFQQKITGTTLMGLSIDWAAPEIKKIFIDQ